MSDLGTVPTLVKTDHPEKGHAYTQLFSNYDPAMQAWMGGLFWDNRPLLTVFATPDRAFAQAEERLRQGNKPGPVAIPLTFSSLSRTGPGVFNPNRFTEAFDEKLYRSRDGKKFLGMRAPKPVTLEYQIEVWGRNKFDIDWVEEQMWCRCRNNEFWITVDHPFPMGKKLVLGWIEDVRDGPIYGDPQKARAIRRTTTIKLNGWIMFRPSETPVVQQIVTDVYNMNPDGTHGEFFFETVEPTTP